MAEAVVKYQRSDQKISGAVYNQQTKIQFREVGRTVRLIGSFQKSNNIIHNAQWASQDHIKLCRYAHFRGLLFVYCLYFGITAAGSFIHVGAAAGAALIDVLWLILFCQYIHVACKVVPLMLRQPATAFLDKLRQNNMLVEVKYTVEGRAKVLRYVQLSEHFRATVLNGQNIDLRAEFNAVTSLGIYVASDGTMTFQILSHSMKCHLRKTQCNSFFLLVFTILHL